MKVRDIGKDYKLVWDVLSHIIVTDNPGFFNNDYLLPDNYVGQSIEEFFSSFNDWLAQFDGKLTRDVISIQDFKTYLQWSDNEWRSYNDRQEWENVYGLDSVIKSFASSEASIMDVIVKKYDGYIYSAFLVDCFDDKIKVFIPYSELRHSNLS